MDETVELYSQKIEYEVPTISPASLSECDVLECDCNGMELDILRNMDIRPRVLIIEVEAPFYKESYGGKEHPRAVLDEIKELDYTIIQQYGHEGIPLTPEEFNQLIDEEYKTASKSQLAHGAKHSPIILAVDSNWKDEL
jgi:hypothetical protein